MTKQKKSFLDKITGSQKDEEEKIEQVEIKKNYEENNEVREMTEDKQVMEDKDWLDNKDNSNKEEGQLTVDVYQTEDLIVIKSVIGGVASESIDISITGDMITIKGNRTNPDKVESDDYYYQECFWGAFSRSIILPCDIETKGVEAIIKNGILTVKLPKIEKNSSMKIKVKEE